MHLLIQWPSFINMISFNKWRWEPFLLLLSMLCQPFRLPNPTVTVEETVQYIKDMLFILNISKGISLIWCLFQSISLLSQRRPWSCLQHGSKLWQDGLGKKVGKHISAYALLIMEASPLGSVHIPKHVLYQRQILVPGDAKITLDMFFTLTHLGK